jgi:hypothetical protein
MASDKKRARAWLTASEGKTMKEVTSGGYSVLGDLVLGGLLLTKARLPDGTFSNQKSEFGKILEALGAENVGIFYGHLEYITAIWYSYFTAIW